MTDTKEDNKIKYVWAIVQHITLERQPLDIMMSPVYGNKETAKKVLEDKFNGGKMMQCLGKIMNYTCEKVKVVH